mgnify:CR=1 FL=1
MKRNGFIYESIMMGFYHAVWVLRQKPQVNGIENLKNLPSQVIFAVTHDSYYEVPSLSRVYKAIEPSPVFTIMAKEEFLDGSYLSTNFFKNSSIARGVFRAIDSTGLPKAFFKKLNLISIPRPFADRHEPAYQNVKKQISRQFSEFKAKISEGFSTLIFPEGTTWGYGGLRRMRSAVYQLVSTSYDQYGKKVYILPINVKVDKLVRGWKDVFIDVGKPQFFTDTQEEFNQRLFNLLQKLHTITFSQIAAYYIKRVSKRADQDKIEPLIQKEQLFEHLRQSALSLQDKVKLEVLPAIDQKLSDIDYFSDKFSRFIAYCSKHKYFDMKSSQDQWILNVKKILSDHPKKIFRKNNPVGFHANELESLEGYANSSQGDPLQSCFEIP